LSLIFLLIYVFPLAMYLASGKNHSPATKGMATVFLLAASISAAFTYHRVGYIAVALEGLVWLYLKRGKRAVLVLVGVLVLTASISSSWLVSLYDPLRQAFSGNDEITSEQFLRGRGYQWFLYLNSYVSSGPFHWVFCNGGSVIADLDPDVNYVLSPNEPHSDYIRVWHAYGIVGFSLYLSVLSQFCAAAVRRLRSPDPFARALGQMMLPMLAAFALLSFTTEPLRYPGASWYLFAIGSALFCLKEPFASAIHAPGRSALAEATS
jgi:O-antigen ligase